MKQRIKKIEDRLSMAVDPDECWVHVFKGSVPCPACGITLEDAQKMKYGINIIMKSEYLKGGDGDELSTIHT